MRRAGSDLYYIDWELSKQGLSRRLDVGYIVFRGMIAFDMRCLEIHGNILGYVLLV